MKTFFTLLLTCSACLGQMMPFANPAFVWNAGNKQSGTVALDTTQLLIQWPLTEGSGSTASNFASASSFFPSGNIFPAPENHFAGSSSKWFDSAVNGTVTVTDSYATDPNGVANNASRWVSDASASYSAIHPFYWDTATYTYSVYLKSNQSTNQTIRFAWYEGGVGFHYSSDQTVTTSWQRFTFTFTRTGTTTGNAEYFCWMVNGSNGTAKDVLIWGAQLEKAGSASTYLGMDQNWNGVLGKTRIVTNDWIPTWTNYGMNFPSSSGNRYVASLGSNSFSKVTVYTIFRRPPQAFIQFVPLLSDLYANNLLGLYASFTSGGYAEWHFNGQTVTADTCWDDGFWHIAAGVYDGSALSLYLDGSLLATKSASVGAVTIRELNLCNVADNNTFRFIGDIGYAIVYNTNHSQSQVRATQSALATPLATKGITLQQLPYFVALEGDSRTYQDWSYPRQALTNSFGTNIHARVFAAIGNGIADVTNRASTVDGAYDSTRAKNILSVHIGYNDQANIAVSTYVASLKKYCQDRMATGWKVIMCTELPSTQLGGYNTWRNNYNTALKADPSFYDVLCDIGADPTMGGDSVPNNTTYYTDKIHPTTLGYTILSTNLVTALKTLVP